MLNSLDLLDYSKNGTTEFLTLYTTDTAITEHAIAIYYNNTKDIQIDTKYLIKKPGLNVEGIVYTVNGEEITALSGAEIFNDYTNNIATGYNSHAEGRFTKATGNQSRTEGSGTIASGYQSHSEGFYTIASGTNQHVQGKYNIDDVDSEGNALNTYAHIVGNGKSNTARSNAHTLDWDGNAEFQGDVKANACGGTAPISLIALYNTIQTLTTRIETLESQLAAQTAETWTFTLEDGTTTTKNIVTEE